VIQEGGLFPHFTIERNVGLVPRLEGWPEERIASRVKEVLESVSLPGDDYPHRFPSELSGGQRQRVAIAQQLLCSEHFLILDEPTTGLDPIMKDKVCDLIKQVASLSEENTIFVVTHDIAAILTIADHLWLLGRVRDGEGRSLGAKVLHTYDLIERGLAWQERPQELPAFAEMQREVRERFATL
jgi:ABC-type proline/glycine betaine transport system ATPase subunit